MQNTITLIIFIHFLKIKTQVTESALCEYTFSCHKHITLNVSHWLYL